MLLEAPVPPPEGTRRFIRYGFMPSRLRHSGAEYGSSRALLEYAVGGVSDGGLMPLLRRFTGALPYLELIRRANAIADPFDARVVEAYWLGNELLDRVEVRQLYGAVLERFGNQLTGRMRELALGKAPAGARPHHSFHVLDVHSRLGQLEHSLQTLDSCRVSWGRVVALAGAELVVERRPLQLKQTKLVLGPAQRQRALRQVDGRGFVDTAHVGDWVSLHWGWVCEVLTVSQRANLERYTRYHLALANQPSDRVARPKKVVSRSGGWHGPGAVRPGDWDAPVYGQLGVLARLGDEVQCHVCSRWYRSLGTHAWQAHKLTAAEYRVIFGLRAQTGLVGPSLRELQQNNARRHLQVYWPAAAVRLRSQTPEQRSAQSRGRKRPLAASLDAANRASWLGNSRRGGQRIRDLWSLGIRQRPQPVNTGWDKARARWRQLLQDPAYRAQLAQRLSTARGGRVGIPCAICGRVFDVQRHLARGDHRRFCTTTCLREFQRQRGRHRGPEMAARSNRPLSKVCEQCGGTFEGPTRRRYCSVSCKVQARAGKATHECPRCGAAFIGRMRQRYCSRHCAAQAARFAQAQRVG